MLDRYRGVMSSKDKKRWLWIKARTGWLLLDMRRRRACRLEKKTDPLYVTSGWAAYSQLALDETSVSLDLTDGTLLTVQYHPQGPEFTSV